MEAKNRPRYMDLFLFLLLLLPDIGSSSSPSQTWCPLRRRNPPNPLTCCPKSPNPCPGPWITRPFNTQPYLDLVVAAWKMPHPWYPDLFHATSTCSTWGLCQIRTTRPSRVAKHSSSSTGNPRIAIWTTWRRRSSAISRVDWKSSPSKIWTSPGCGGQRWPASWRRRGSRTSRTWTWSPWLWRPSRLRSEMTTAWPRWTKQL